MSETLSPRARRRQQTIEEILDAAWRLARRDGLASISMRDLGREVGLRAQSLYAYVDSKGALYDAMFRQGQEQFRERTSSWPTDLSGVDDPRGAAKEQAHAFVEFCTEDTVRYQLLFQRVIPGWEPTPETYALAVDQLEGLRRSLESLGFEGQAALDLWTALLTGITSQQISNDPGGDRWTGLVDLAVDLFFDQLSNRDPDRPTGGTP